MENTLAQLLDRPIAYHRIFVTLTGSVTAAVMLSQAVYWSRRTGEDGWFFKTREEWEEETGMGRAEQETARKKLKESGFWQEKRIGLPARMFYRVDFEAMANSLSANQMAGIKQSARPDSGHQLGRIPANRNAGIKPTFIIETTSETTSETTTNTETVPAIAETGAAKNKPCPHEEIIDLYHKILPALPRVLVQRWKGSLRERNLRSLWQADEIHRDMRFWEWFFRAVRTNPHWLGENDRGWTADLGWLVKRENFDKVCTRGYACR